MNTLLLERIADLAQLRRVAAEQDAELKARKDAFAVENSVLIQTADLARTAVTNAETAIKAVAAEEYARTKDTLLCPGITVKMFSTIKYSPAVAFEWAKEKKMAVTPEALDQKAFEKIANASQLSFVTYGKEPRVQIASDLDSVLAGAEAAA